MAGESWSVDYVRSTTYLDNRNLPVKGFEVGITLHPFEDAITLELPTDDPDKIAAAAQQALDRRVKLQEMSDGG
jgi:hypothetical protein